MPKPVMVWIPCGMFEYEVALSLMAWQPVIDGDIIPACPLDRIAAGAGAGVDLIVGTNTDEHRLFLVPGGEIDQVTPKALAGVVAAYRLPVEPTLAAYRAAHPGAGAGDLLASIQTDWCWCIPAIRLAALPVILRRTIPKPHPALAVR